MASDNNKMYGVVNGLYFCNQERTEELNSRISERNIPSQPLQPEFSIRPVSTKPALMPILDQRASVSVPLKSFPVFNTNQIFNPGTAQAPWSGFATNINTESRLRNQFFALQRCEQSEYVPSSSSSLFNAYVPNLSPEQQPFPNLFEKPELPPFNPNPMNLGDQILNNSTRVQLQNACSK